MKFKDIGKKRIPTILGLIVLVAGLGAGLYLVGRATIIPKATAEETPKKIKISNISENGFSVSWVTDIATSGFIRLGTSENNLERTVGDDRDQLSGNVNSFATHQVTLRRLSPDTKYFFKIGSGANKALFDNEGSAYTLITPSVLGTPPPADTVYGRVEAGEGIPAEGAIVYLTLPNATPLSALVKADGNWAASLSTSRTKDLSNYVTYDRQAATLELFVQGEENKTATAVTVTANDAPVPTISLGQSHDFRSEIPVDQEIETTQGELPPGASEQQINEATGSSQFSVNPLAGNQQRESSFALEILNPDKEGETLVTTQPEIFGSSPKNVTISIKVESPVVYKDEIKVNDNGLWNWTPPAELTPGEHTVTASYTDENGVLQEVKRKFIVAAASSGNDLPAFEATPSATAAPSASPSAVPRVSQPTTTSGTLVEAGNLTPTIALVILGLSLLGAGLFWQLRLPYE